VKQDQPKDPRKLTDPIPQTEATAKRKGERPFSKRDETFCQAYVESGIGAHAYRLAGYGGNSKYAGQHASSKLTLDKITRRIVEIRDEVTSENKRRLAAINVKAEHILAELGGMGFVDPLELFDKDGKPRALKDIPRRTRAAIKKMSVDKHGTVHIELTDKVRALELLAKINGTLASKSRTIRAGIRMPDGTKAAVEIEVGD
jgi:predicted deacylase